MNSRRKPAPLLGSHMSTAGGVDKALERGASIGCSSIQIFLKNNMQWSGPPLKPDEIARNYVWLHNQQRSAWTFELDLRPWKENW